MNAWCERSVLLLIILLVAAFAVDAFNHESSRSPPSSLKQNMNADGSPTLQAIRAGFIGCGTIATAIATGLASPDHANYLSQYGFSIESIAVTRRSESKSTKLKEDFPSTVTVYESAEDVVTNSEIVFLCVLPQQLDTVLDDLKKKGAWRADHTLVSLVVSVDLFYILSVVISSNLCCI